MLSINDKRRSNGKTYSEIHGTEVQIWRGANLDTRTLLALVDCGKGYTSLDVHMVDHSGECWTSDDTPLQVWGEAGDYLTLHGHNSAPIVHNAPLVECETYTAHGCATFAIWREGVRVATVVTTDTSPTTARLVAAGDDARLISWQLNPDGPYRRYTRRDYPWGDRITHLTRLR